MRVLFVLALLLAAPVVHADTLAQTNELTLARARADEREAEAVLRWARRARAWLVADANARVRLEQVEARARVLEAQARVREAEALRALHR